MSADLAAQLGHPLADAPAVQLDLGLTGATAADADAARGAAADLAGQVATPATQARQQVLQLGQLDLGLALAALGVLGEDVEDQRGAVDDLDLDRSPPAGGAGRGSARRRRSRCRRRWPRRRRAAPAPCPSRCRWRGPGYWRRWMSPSSTWEPAVSARSCSSRSEFSASVAGPGGPDADQDDPLEPQLAVFDLGDILELGGEARHAAQRLALLEVHVAVLELVERGVFVHSCHL